MDFTINRRFIDYYKENKKETHFELLDEDPMKKFLKKGGENSTIGKNMLRKVWINVKNYGKAVDFQMT